MDDVRCDVCHRVGSRKLPLLCAVDARNRLYEFRLGQANALLRNEQLNQEIETISGDRSNNTSLASSRAIIDERIIIEAAAQQRIDDIVDRAKALKSLVDAAKRDIQKRRVALSERQSALEKAHNGLDVRRERTLEQMKKGTQITTYKWSQLGAALTSGRAFLCVEAARLVRLERRRNSQSEILQHEYRISGIPILDLRTMCNKVKAADLTTSLSHIAHLFVLTTHYLAIKCPAEITLPHRDYPLPTIFTHRDSHKSFKVPFPGGSTNSSSFASRHEDPSKPHLARPRPLFTNKPLPALAREDLSMFLEAVALMAYNIAWACKTQGIQVGSSPEITAIEDIFDIGTNLHRLLLSGTEHHTAPDRPVASRKSTALSSTKSDSESVKRPEPPSPVLGLYSHGTAQHNLAGTTGSALQRSFRLPSWASVVETLKQHVANEVAGTGWTTETEDASVILDAEDGDSVVVAGGKAGGIRDKTLMGGPTGMSEFGVQSFMSMQTVQDVGDEREKKPGTRGWTVLKERS